MPSCFSMPPIRCSRPAVPGTAHGRASVSGSRRNGQKTSLPSSSTLFGPAAKFGAISGRSATSGMRQGSEPLAR